MVHEFEPRVGLCADSSEPGACFRFCVSLSLCPFPAHALSLKNKQTLKKIFFKEPGEAELISLWNTYNIPDTALSPLIFNSN